MISSICIETLFKEYPLLKRIEETKKAGFDYIEFWSWEDKNLHDIKSACKDSGVSIASFSGDKDFSAVDITHNEKYLDYIKSSAEKADYLYCENLVVHSNALGEGGAVLCDYKYTDKSSLMQNMAEVMRSAGEIARQAGVMLVLEALNTKIDHAGNVLYTTSDSVETVNAAGSANVKILYDIYHMQIMEGNVINTLADNFNAIGYIHAADVPGRHEPGTGELNYRNILKALKRLGYSGVVGFELIPKTDSLQAIAKIHEALGEKT